MSGRFVCKHGIDVELVTCWMCVHDKATESKELAPQPISRADLFAGFALAGIVANIDIGNLSTDLDTAIDRALWIGRTMAERS